MNQVINKLWTVLNRQSTDSVYAQIARTLIKDINHLESTSSTYIARHCGVSKPTISRFSRLLGYNDFYEFRVALAAYEPDWRHRWDVAGLPASAGTAEALRRFGEDVRARLTFLDDPVIAARVSQLVQEMRTFHRTRLMGNMQSGDLAQILHSSLYSVTDSIEAVMGYEERHRALHPLAAGTLLVVLSVNGAFLDSYLECGEHLSKSPGSKAWLLTCNPELVPNEGFDEVINTRTGGGASGGNLSLDVLATAIAFEYRRSVRGSDG